MFQNSLGQTKLSNNEKSDLAIMRKNFKEVECGEIFRFPEQGIVVAIAPEFTGSKMLRVAYALKSDTETKFRPNVGEYLALSRWYYRDGPNVMIVRDGVYSYIAGFVRDAVTL